MSLKSFQAVKNTEEYGSLTAFTALEPFAVGGLVGLLVARGPSATKGIDWATMAVFTCGLLALIISLFHLGRPWRAPLALLHLSTSWLSREVILFGLFLLMLAVYAVVPVFILNSQVLILFGITAALTGLLATIATGKTYQLHAHPSWDRWLTIASFPSAALSTGLLFGFFVARVFLGELLMSSSAWVIAASLLILSTTLSTVRIFLHQSASKEALASHQLAVGPYLWLLVVRLIAVVIALSMILINNGAEYLAWIPALLGDFADRAIFFNTTVPVTLRGRYI